MVAFVMRRIKQNSIQKLRERERERRIKQIYQSKAWGLIQREESESMF
jgi:hypothetical protein